MKILALMGSQRKLGNSDVLLLETMTAAVNKGAKVKKIRLSELDIATCKGDLACVYRGSCSTKDDMQQLLAEVVAADGLILAAPTYLLSASGLIKNIADRGLMLTPYLEVLKGRPRKAVTISVAGNQKWNPMGVEGLNQLALILGFQVIDYLEGYSPGPGEVLLEEANITKAAILGEQLVTALERDIPPRKPEDNQCPVCFSRSWRWRKDGMLECPYCLVTAIAEIDGGNIKIIPNSKAAENHFWDLSFRREHINDWVIPSKDRYLKVRKDIKTLQKKYL